jgi:hypothetical protein
MSELMALAPFARPEARNANDEAVLVSEFADQRTGSVIVTSAQTRSAKVMEWPGP